MNINISAYLSSIRPYRWMKIHEMLEKTGLNFEIVIVGPNEPDFTLPKEIKFFKSNVKPSQCFHAAASACVGETMLQMVDDVEYTDGAILAMYERVMQADNVMASCVYLQNGNSNLYHQNISGEVMNISYLPLLPVCGMFKREAFLKMGGLDRRFDGVMSELDLYMRMRINGYNTHFINGFCNESTDHQVKEKTSLCGKFWNHDRPIFMRLWQTGSTLYPIRNDIFRGYSDKDILTVNQGYE